MSRIYRALTALLDERHNRHAWLVPLTLLMAGLAVLAAGVGVDLWWLPLAVPLTARPANRNDG